MKLNCLNYSQQHGEVLDRHPDMKTQVYFDGKYYQYSNTPQEVQEAWEAEGEYEWDSFESGEITYMNAESEG